MSGQSEKRRYPKEYYTILIICPLALEAKAVINFFDEKHVRHEMSDDDSNFYTPGKIDNHFVVMAIPPSTGSNSTAILVANAWRTFTSLRYTFLVGIGAGISQPTRNIELGDVVIGEYVRQYDYRKVLSDGKLKLITHLINPPPTLKQLANWAVEFAPAFLKDIFQEKTRSGTPKIPKIHYGIIASGNSVVKDEEFRDWIRRETDAICVEMEASGLTENYKCLTVRGISDFADRNKNDKWQRRAAEAAAAVTAYILKKCPLTEREMAFQSHQASIQPSTRQMPRPPPPLNLTPITSRQFAPPTPPIIPGDQSRNGYFNHSIDPFDNLLSHLSNQSGVETAPESSFDLVEDPSVIHEKDSFYSLGEANEHEDVEFYLTKSKFFLAELEKYKQPKEFNALIRGSIQKAKDNSYSALTLICERQLRDPEAAKSPLYTLLGYSKILYSRAIFAELHLKWYERQEENPEFGGLFIMCYRDLAEGRSLVEQYADASTTRDDYQMIADTLDGYLKTQRWAIEASKRFAEPY